MKHKFSSMGRVAIALVLALSLSLVMAVPVAASHDSTATVAFTEGAETMQSTASSLDVEVTSSAVSSLGNITEVVIDFSGTAFTGIGAGTLPGTWTLVGIADGVVTYTDDTGIAPGDSVIFVPVVTNPAVLGLATNPVVTTSDAGSKAVLVASEATGEIAYEAVAIGSAGNAFTVEYLDADSYSGLSAAMVGDAISVELADSGSGPTSIATDVVTAIDAVATGEVTASTTEGDTIVPVMSATALSGGSAVQLDKPCPLTGELVITEQLLVVDVAATPATSASLASYDIDFTTIGAIAADETITITFPAEYDLALVEEVDVSLIVDITPYTTGTVMIVGQVVTITGDGTNPIAGTVALVEVAIANTHVKNPPASGDYLIAVATTIGDHGLGEVTVTPATFGVVAGTDDTVTAGTAFAVTVTALNFDEDTDIGYTGDHFIDFTSGGTGTIPAFELITFTAGEGTSSQYFVLTVATETPTITATEGTLAGTSEVITINPATFVQFDAITGPASVEAGVDFTGNDIVVTAQDAEGNAVTGYTGTVTWTSSDDDAVLPAAYTFTTGVDEDNGVHTFLGSLFTLKTVGTVDQTITVTDAAAGVSQESADITVTPAAADSIVVSASTGVIEADNSDSATITVTAKDEFGNVDTNLAGDQSITIESSLGAIAAANPSFTLGEATTTLTSDNELGTATIRVEHATYDDAMTTVKLLADIGIDSITVTVDKTTILNNGVDVRTITATYVDALSATVTDAEGADYAFTFSVNDEDTVLSTTDPVNPVVGVATVTLTTTAASGTTITVTADGTGAGNGTVGITVTEGTYPIDLATGWNLISLPLIPTDTSIDEILAGADVTVNKVAYYTGGPAGSWLSYSPPAPGNLDTMDDGKGYWIDVSATGELTVAGVQLALPGQSPPTYDVVVGWNLIGFTSTSTTYKVELYLGAVMDSVQAMYKYDAATGAYTAVITGTNLEPGQGYWLAINADGKIYP